MATRKSKAPAAPARPINPAAAWPFPVDRGDREAVDPVDEAEDRRADFDAHAEATIGSASRVQVASLRLYTDPAQNQVQRLALEQLFESPFNPRTHYDAAALQELADTIRGVGVMEPILVRPVATDGYEIKQGDQAVQAYEIVFGHRRTRAAKLAGEPDVPAIVRELTDAQAAQLQAIENVQRKDLDPVEEARGYAHYLKVHGVSKDQLAAEIGLSRSHVYARLKLATAAPAVLDALRAGEIYEENALRIARLPTEKLQEKALAAVRSNHLDLDDGGKRSVRRIQDFLRERFTLKLKEALFDPEDAALLVDAGSCTDCVKRTGNAPEFADLAGDTDKDWGGKPKAGPDLCTDPDCFDAKKKQHLANEADKLEAKGKTVVAGAKARAAIGADGTVKGAYVALKDVRAELAKAKKGGKGADVQTVLIQDPRTGKTVEAVKVDDLQAAGAKVKETPKKNDYAAERLRQAEEQKKRQAAAQEETRFNTALLSAVREAAAGKPFSTQLLQIVTACALQGVDWGGRDLLAKLHGSKSFERLRKDVGQLPPDRLTTLLLDCALIDNVKSNGYRDHKPEALLAAAKHLEVDIAAIKKALADKPADTQTQDLLEQPDDGAAQDEEEEAIQA